MTVCNAKMGFCDSAMSRLAFVKLRTYFLLFNMAITNFAFIILVTVFAVRCYA